MFVFTSVVGFSLKEALFSMSFNKDLCRNCYFFIQKATAMFH